MARAHFVSKARKPIYQHGKYVNYKSKKGKNKGKVLSRLDVTKPENKKDKILIKVGEGYYWWQFKGGNKIYSKTAPKRSALTRSGYLSQLYDIEDRISSIRANVDTADDLESVVDDIKSDLESLKDEVEESLQNMPEHLQESSSSGQLLQERIDSLDNAISEFDSIDCTDYEEQSEDDLRAAAIEDLQLDEDNEEALQDSESDINEAMARIKQDKFNEWLDEKCEEIENISFD